MSDGYSADSQIREINMLRRKVERIEAERDAWEATAQGHYKEAFTLRAERDTLLRQIAAIRETFHGSPVLEVEVLRALLADIRAEGRVTGDIAVRLIAALKE